MADKYTVDKTIDSKFIKEQLEDICRARESACNSITKYCRELNAKNADQINWGKCAECVGYCFIGDKRLCWTKDPSIRDVLNDCLKASVNIDWLLHLSQKRYRDHSTHALFVAVFGWFLLGCNIGRSSKNPKGVTLKKWISKRITEKRKLPEEYPEEYVEVAWWIASLLHDHAYPLQHILRVAPSLAIENSKIWLDQIWALLGFSPEGTTNPLNKVLKGLYDHTFLRTLRPAVEESANDCKRRESILKKLRGHLIAPGFFKDSELCKESESCYDHGLLGAANISALLRGPKNDIIRTAIRAIGIHNGAACHEGVDVQNDPLAFLLVLCDECQEWERRTWVEEEKQLKSESGSIKLRGPVKGQDGDSLEVIFEYTDPVCLRDTKWDYQSFKDKKEKAFKRLCRSKKFPIKGIRFNVSLPHEVRFELKEKTKGENQ